MQNDGGNAVDAILLYILLAAAGLVLGVFLGLVLGKRMIESRQGNLEREGKKLIEDALREAERIKKEASLQSKDQALEVRHEAEKEVRARKADLIEEEKRLSNKLDQIERKIDILDKREMELLNKEKGFVKGEQELAERKKALERIIEDQRFKLEQLSGISRDEAKKMLMESIESEARMEAAKTLIRIENEMKIQADRKAKNILALAISRYAGDYVAEKTVSVVPLPNDEMKGRIIGREGRNIRAIEAATGIDIIIDDTPEAVILSGFNPVRREVARQSLERLIADGRIHPARIEEVVDKVTKELEVSMREVGEQATFDVGAHGVHLELIKLLGRLKYRTSYGQNVLQHSLEVAFLAGTMAAELGLNVKQAKRAGLLHDIGKAVDHEVEGSHASIGADLAKKYGESPRIVNAIAAHHEEVEPGDVIDILVQSADALSGARPGARKEMLESYVKRLEDLERVANNFEGVEKSFAIQAGREVRIVVNSSEVNDAKATMLSKEIAKKIEEDLTYPGQIRVTVIRETRAVEYAK
ncbi:MAG: ribonuclease Y [Deltaproteobacteria bacterium CG23_combo_of_CG06-09_8_20_14_all_60_8]|nr:MAG: ribonuclease Y [Desulfobacterales bacterium CG2_30_60_27]PIP44286.1 MAG: ribonuclease Y [Deltaproteobacteria bacterium CG23_combo_of_CG06-09_8_20_14_all_60_8]